MIFRFLNTLQKFLKLVFVFSAVITGWTSVIVLSGTTFNIEIKELIAKMYLNQKNFIFNIKDLSVLLVKDANERLSEKNHIITPLNNSKTD